VYDAAESFIRDYTSAATTEAEGFMPEAVVRPLRPGERAAWEPLWRGYLAFYETTQAPDAMDAAWRRLHDSAEPMFGLGAHVDGRMCGIVHYLFHRSFWTIGDYCYLQDLYVAEQARNIGLGRALIEAVYREAKAKGASRVYWLTQEGNATARALYDKLAQRSGFIQYRKIF
jgi:GNAT superfamily N-acetyltransferase